MFFCLLFVVDVRFGDFLVLYVSLTCMSGIERGGCVGVRGEKDIVKR